MHSQPQWHDYYLRNLRSKALFAVCVCVCVCVCEAHAIHQKLQIAYKGTKN